MRGEDAGVHALERTDANGPRAILNSDGCGGSWAYLPSLSRALSSMQWPTPQKSRGRVSAFNRLTASVFAVFLRHAQSSLGTDTLASTS